MEGKACLFVRMSPLAFSSMNPFDLFGTLLAVLNSFQLILKVKAFVIIFNWLQLTIKGPFDM